jgi:hypothetical protein
MADPLPTDGLSAIRARDNRIRFARFIPSSAAAPSIEKLPSGQRIGFLSIQLILTVGTPQRVRKSQTFSSLKAQPRAATNASRLRIVAISPSFAVWH